MPGRILTACLMMTLLTGCATTPSDSAVCAGTAAAARALAAALIQDGGANSQRAGLRLLDQMAAGCHP